jgi:fumarate reductase subunit D
MDYNNENVRQLLQLFFGGFFLLVLLILTLNDQLIALDRVMHLGQKKYQITLKKNFLYKI